MRNTGLGNASWSTIHTWGAGDHSLVLAWPCHDRTLELSVAAIAKQEHLESAASRAAEARNRLSRHLRPRASRLLVIMMRRGPGQPHYIYGFQNVCLDSGARAGKPDYCRVRGCTLTEIRCAAPRAQTC
jgi:hypothetical protein